MRDGEGRDCVWAQFTDGPALCLLSTNEKTSPRSFPLRNVPSPCCLGLCFIYPWEPICTRSLGCGGPKSLVQPKENEDSCIPQGTGKGLSIPSALLLLWVPTTVSVVCQGKAGEGREIGENPQHRLVVCPGWTACMEKSFLCPFLSPHRLILRRAPPLSSPSHSTMKLEWLPSYKHK